MNRNLILVFGFVFCAMVLNAQKSGPRQTVSLDANWRFHLGNAADPDNDFNYRVADIFSKSGHADGTAIDPAYTELGWTTVQVPHDWAIDLPFVHSTNGDVESHGYKPIGGLFPENSVGWYRKHFDVNAADKGKRFVIRFDGVFRDAKFWINGFYLGTNESGYMGVTYDITDFINFDKKNVLVVRVDASQYEGWFYEGAGIYRHVWLVTYNDIHVSDHGVFVQADVGKESASVTFESTIENSNSNGLECTVSSCITDKIGKVLASAQDQKILISSLGKETVRQHINIEHPRLWSLNDPNLYKAVVVLRSGDQSIDSVVTLFGIRTIRFDADKGLFLNGENIKIHGVCCHQDHAGLGVAVPDDIVLYRLRLLKEMGVNAYRTSHNPPAPELLDACDSLGILVLDETRLLNSGPEYLAQFERMILRDRNHPSIFLWSIGNEEGFIQGNEIGRRIASTFLAHQQQLDPTRTATYAADLGNFFNGINEVIPVRGFNYRQSAVADYHKSHPLQPIIGTEMGSTVTTRGIYIKDTNRCYVPDEDITAPSWASTAETWWKLCATQPWWIGGFVWTGFDYRGEPTPYHWPNISSHFGIMDVCGFPKNIYYYYQSWWTDKDVLHISPHWNWKGQEGKPIHVFVNSNADNVELFLNDKSLGKKTMERNSHLEWDVPYQPGILKAIASKKGRAISSQVETTGEPIKIILVPDRKVFTTTSQDFIVVNISVVDKENREVPDAGNLIRFIVKGDAYIVGVGNGDPSSHEPDICHGNQWQRKLFNGKCQVIIKSGKISGSVEIDAISDGLITGSVNLDEIP
ncbi:MAG: beta-galactosidase GalA [Bacteroidales bacterium]